MTSITWRKRLAVWRNRLYLYPAPEAMPRTLSFWVATGIVSLLVVVFSTYFILYLTGRQTAFMTNAEDLGIMDQAIWNTVHGNLLHQTICNIVNDTNCYSLDGINRFAIHFEPILFPVSLLYLLWPDPRTLLVLQTLVVASGAFPAFWLARLRLRNEWAGVVCAVIYLLYPAQQFALVDDFHAVTFTAAFLLYTLYFMYTRRTVWLFVFAVLALACKEEISVVIALYGLWSIAFQHRRRSGLGLIILGILWVGVGLYIVHIFSPTGQSLLTSRYTYLGKGIGGIASTILLHPGLIVKQHILEHNHLFYLRSLFGPAGYLPLLAPWVLILALPTLALNVLSSDPNMYSGLYQYNAEMVPVLIFATIEAVVLLIWLAQWGLRRFQQWRESREAIETKTSVRTLKIGNITHQGLLVLLLGFVLFSTVRADVLRNDIPLPFGRDFHWPQTTAHTELAQSFIDMIPADATVSAQSALVPHISHRATIYMFPYGVGKADYIFLDVTGDIYPYADSEPYIHEVKSVLLVGNYGVVAARDGYILLKKGLPPPGIAADSPSHYSSALDDVDHILPNLPDEFCSFVRIPSQQIIHSAQATFTSTSSPVSSVNLVGYNVAAYPMFSLTAGYMQITADLTVPFAPIMPLQIVAFIVDQAGHEHFASTDFPALAWCPANSWRPGAIYNITSRIINLGGQNIPTGPAHIAIALLPLTHPFSTIMDVQDRLPLKVVSGPKTVSSTSGSNGLQLADITLIP